MFVREKVPKYFLDREGPIVLSTWEDRVVVSGANFCDM